MTRSDIPAAGNGGRIAAEEIAEALTRAPFTYDDAATQVFTPDGRTTYTENGSTTFGEWGVKGDGQFWSFWPPTYRAEYDVSWITDADDVVGVKFIELSRRTEFDGRYSPEPDSPQGSPGA